MEKVLAFFSAITAGGFGLKKVIGLIGLGKKLLKAKNAVKEFKEAKKEFDDLPPLYRELKKLLLKAKKEEFKNEKTANAIVAIVYRGVKEIDEFLDEAKDLKVVYDEVFKK